jgi:hypothetical protein
MALLRKELSEYEAGNCDMTEEERNALHKWVADGNSPNDNPYTLYDGDGYIMDYLQACRIGADMMNNPDDYYWGSEVEQDGLGDETPV